MVDFRFLLRCRKDLFMPARPSSDEIRQGIMSKTRWYLHDRSRNETHRELSGAEAVNILMTIGDDERTHWYAWKVGMQNWVLVGECPEIQALLNRETAGSFKRVSVAEAPLPSTSSRVDRRKHPRVGLRLKVVIVSGTRSFRTTTRDISLGGLCLAHAVPWSVQNRVCRVFITDRQGKHSIEFRATLLEDLQDRRRLAFSEGDERFKDRLQDWIEDEIQRQKSDGLKKAS